MHIQHTPQRTRCCRLPSAHIQSGTPCRPARRSTPTGHTWHKQRQLSRKLHNSLLPAVGDALPSISSPGSDARHLASSPRVWPSDSIQCSEHTLMLSKPPAPARMCSPETARSPAGEMLCRRSTATADRNSDGKDGRSVVTRARLMWSAWPHPASSTCSAVEKGVLISVRTAISPL